MKKLSLAFLFVAAIVTACGSDGNVNSDSTPGDDAGLTPPGNNGKADGGTHDVTPLPDAGAPIDQDGGVVDTDSGTGDTDSGVVGQDSGSGGDQDSGSTGGQDSGSGGGDQDGGTTTADSGGGDQDSGSGGGTADSGTGGGGDQDSGSGGTTDGGQDSGSGNQDSGTCGHDESCTPHSCTYTQGYYKNHTSSVTGLTLGGVSYTASQVLGFLNATPNGDDSIILAKQLIAALLNGGACDCNSATTVQAAQDWMAANKDADGTLPYGTCCALSTDPGCTAYTLGQTLDAYNSGLSGTPHCE